MINHIQKQIDKLEKLYFPYINTIDSIKFIESILLSLNKEENLTINDISINDPSIKQNLKNILDMNKYKLSLFEKNNNYPLIKEKLKALKEKKQLLVNLQNDINNLIVKINIIKNKTGNISLNNYLINSFVDINTVKNNALINLENNLIIKKNKLKELGETI